MAVQLRCGSEVFAVRKADARTLAHLQQAVRPRGVNADGLELLHSEADVWVRCEPADYLRRVGRGDTLVGTEHCHAVLAASRGDALSPLQVRARPPPAPAAAGPAQSAPA